MNNIVLDTSALLALIQNQRGSEIIKSLLSYVVCQRMNMTEVLTALKRTNIDTVEILTLITAFIAIIVLCDLEQAKYAPELHAYIVKDYLWEIELV